MAEVVRQEKKYLITQSQRIQLQHQFSILIKSDPHNESNGYRVRSLYFDTLNDRDFQEKEDAGKLQLPEEDSTSPFSKEVLP